MKKQLNIVLMGAPGSGKGTQAEHICSTFELPHVATGNIFRENLKQETELGKLAKTYMDKGDLVPDDVTEAMVKDRLAREDVANGFVLDGFPRTESQAKALTQIMQDLGRELAGVLYIKVSDEEIITRLSGRQICRKCQRSFHTKFNPFTTCPGSECEGEHLYQRDDDKPETVRARLDTFHAQTKPLVNYYQDTGLLVEIEGEGDMTAITDTILSTVRGLQ